MNNKPILARKLKKKTFFERNFVNPDPLPDSVYHHQDGIWTYPKRDSIEKAQALANRTPEQVAYDIFVDKLGVEKEEMVLDDDIFDDFGADSLDQIELVMEFEKEFEKPLPDSLLTQMLSVRDFIEYFTKE